MKNRVMELVEKICNIESTDCRSLNKVDLARKLMDLANVPDDAEIKEIPLDWNNQVVILFLFPEDKNYYSLFAGIGCDGNFYFELSITGVLENDSFVFFEEEGKKDQVLPINYFEKQKANDEIMENCLFDLLEAEKEQLQNIKFCMDSIAFFENDSCTRLADEYKEKLKCEKEKLIDTRKDIKEYFSFIMDI